MPVAPDFSRFDAERHFRPRISALDFAQQKGDDLLWSLIEPISVMVAKAETAAEGISRLSPEQKTLYYWWDLDGQVTNGGFIQFYWNGYGIYIDALIEGLRFMGESELLPIVEKSKELYLLHKSRFSREIDLAEHANTFSPQSAELPEFNELDNKYYDINTDIISYFEASIRSNTKAYFTNEFGEEMEATTLPVIQEFHSNGNLKRTASFTNGKLHGAVSVYTPNGILDYSEQYANGFCIQKEFFGADGLLNKRELTDPETRIKTTQVFSESGKMIREYSETPKGVYIGNKRVWDENGNLKSFEVHYGKYQLFDVINHYPNSSQESVVKYKKEVEYLESRWDESGVPQITNGNGVYKTAYTEGAINFVYECQYVNGVKHGAERKWQDGILKYEGQYTKGKPTGIHRIFNNEGKLFREDKYKNGVCIAQVKQAMYKKPTGILTLDIKQADDYIQMHNLETPDISAKCLLPLEIEKQVIFPPHLLAAGNEQMVGNESYWVIIDKSGAVQDVQQIMSLNANGNNLAQHLKTARYEPATKNSIPIPSVLWVGAKYYVAEGADVA